jgi:alkanesulfonate monooxygenase SsuD/methylene tetrahydromethanopterin reductase-like flavin-dependent oxidoreductase (luciferase family)
MKFSMIFEAQLSDPTAAREATTIRDCIDQAVLAEEVGFDGIWAVEHHSTVGYSHMSAPEVFLSAVAARTSRIRIGHGAVCMAFNYNYPTRVAERAAMLDVISDGRLNLGAARGATDQELSLCNVDRDGTKAEVEETLRLVAAAWRDGDAAFSWDSDLLQVKAAEGRPAHTILPRPIQTPHPPLYLACSSPETVETAARYGVGALVLGFAGTDAVADMRRRHLDAIATRDPAGLVSPGITNDEFVALCPTLVLDDRDEAIRKGARAQRFFAESISYWAAPDGTPWATDTENEDNLAYMHARTAEGGRTTATFNPDHAYGTPEDAIAYVQRLQDAGVTEVMCLIQMGTLSQDDQLETIRQWGEYVIPHFRGESDGAVTSGGMQWVV